VSLLPRLDAVDAHDIIQLVLQHLGSDEAITTSSSSSNAGNKHTKPTANQQLALAAARYVHRVSRGCLALARGVVVHVNLSHVDLSDNFWTPARSSPWALLGAAPRLRSLKLRAKPALDLHGIHRSCFEGIAARLTQLDLEIDGSGEHALPQVLACCTGLQRLRLCRSKSPFGSGGCFFPGIVRQLQQLRIECLEVEGAQPGVLKRQGDGTWRWEPTNPTWLSALTGLQQLRVQGCHAPTEALTHLSKLSKLSWAGGSYKELSAELPLLTQLRHLELDISSSLFDDQLSSLSGLTGVTQLQLSLRASVPEDLGSWMPQLEAFKLQSGGGLCRLPEGLTRLTRLEAPVSSSSRILGQLRECTTLVKLDLRLEGCVELRDSCNGLTRLEVLRLVRVPRQSAASATPPGWRGLQLGAVCRLRSLSLCGGSGSGMAAAVVSAAGHSQLTRLQLEADGPPMEQAEAEQLFATGQLAKLQQLQLTCEVFPCPVQLGAWLGQQVQLTRLVLKSAAGLASSAALEQLPVSLCELHLPGLRKQQVPACLARLQQLQRLCLGASESAADVRQLPAWLSQLQHLEWLDVSGTRVTSPQPVLGQLPLLRRVVLPPKSGYGAFSLVLSDPAVVFAHAPHLHRALFMDAQ
jgi:hypothetical protein